MAKKKTSKKKTTRKKAPAKKKAKATKRTPATRKKAGTRKRTKAQAAVTHDDMIDLVADLLARRTRKGVIVQALREYSGQNLGIHKVEDYISSARTLLRARLKLDREEHEGYAVALCEAIISDPRAAYRDILRAHEQLIEILGLGKKWRLEEGAPRETAAEILAFIKGAKAQQQETTK